LCIAKRAELQVSWFCAAGQPKYAIGKCVEADVALHLQGGMRDEHRVLPRDPHPARARFAIGYAPEAAAQSLATDSEHIGGALEIHAANQVNFIGKLGHVLFSRVIWSLRSFCPKLTGL
jgi:hypothetical protein